MRSMNGFENTLRTNMKPFFEEKDANVTRFKKLLRWVAKNEKFGAYAVCEQSEKGFDVQLFCPLVNVARDGKRYVKSCQ